MSDALRFRHRLVPYLHTMNHRARADGVPLVRPMYHLAPEDDARLRGAQPVRVRLRAARRADHHAARPGDAARRGRAPGCPPGTWIDIFTATVYDGDREIELHRDARLDPRAAARRRHPAAGGRGRPRRHAQPRAARAARRAGRGRRVHADRGRRHRRDDRRRTHPSRWDQAAGALTIGAADDPHGVLHAVRVVGGADGEHARRLVPAIGVRAAGIAGVVPVPSSSTSVNSPSAPAAHEHLEPLGVAGRRRGRPRPPAGRCRRRAAAPGSSRGRGAARPRGRRRRRSR